MMSQWHLHHAVFIYPPKYKEYDSWLHLPLCKKYVSPYKQFKENKTKRTIYAHSED